MTKDFPNLKKVKNIQIQKTPLTPSRINTKKIMPNHIKLLKTKDEEKILKIARGQAPGWLSQLSVELQLKS